MAEEFNIPVNVIKSDKRKEPFNQDKLLNSVKSAGRSAGVFPNPTDCEQFKEAWHKSLNVPTTRLADTVEDFLPDEAGYKCPNPKERRNELNETVGDCARRYTQDEMLNLRENLANGDT